MKRIVHGDDLLYRFFQDVLTREPELFALVPHLLVRTMGVWLPLDQLARYGVHEPIKSYAAWVTLHGTHIGSAFPFMAGRPATGARVAWSQLHVFRIDGNRLVEHWAVRDDLRVLEAIDQTT